MEITDTNKILLKALVPKLSLRVNSVFAEVLIWTQIQGLTFLALNTGVGVMLFMYVQSLFFC